MQAVGTDQGEERRQEGTAVRTVTLMDQVLELIDFHAHEAEAQQPGDAQPQEHLTDLLAVHGDHAQAEGQRRGQQQRGFPRHERQLEQVLRAGATIGAAGQHHVGGKQRGEDEAVAHQVHPETEDGVAAGVVVLVVVMAMGRRMCGVPVVHGRGIGAHAFSSDFTRPWASRCLRCSFSMRSTSAAGTQ
ncbi:hypothetical protein D3C73_1122210 [compost metagenome]